MRLQPFAQQAILRKRRRAVGAGHQRQQAVDQCAEGCVGAQVVAPGLVARATQQVQRDGGSLGSAHLIGQVAPELRAHHIGDQPRPLRLQPPERLGVVGGPLFQPDALHLDGQRERQVQHGLVGEAPAKLGLGPDKPLKRRLHIPLAQQLVELADDRQQRGILGQGEDDALPMPHHRNRLLEGDIAPEQGGQRLPPRRLCAGHPAAAVLAAGDLEAERSRARAR